MQPKLKIETMKVADLVPYAGNAKEHPDWQVDQIAESIETFGMNDPVGIWHDKDGRPTIVEGHGRVLALRQLGIEECPVIALDHLDDDARRAYVHVHNQTTLTSGFDLDALNAELADIPGFDWEAFGFEVPETQEGPTAEDVEEVDVPVAPEPRCEPGQKWSLGGHILVCGDATSAEDLERLLGGVRPRFVFTDPPYGVAIGSKNAAINAAAPGKGGIIEEDIANDTLPPDELYEMLVAAFANLREHVDEACSYYVSAPQGGDLGMMMMMMMRDAGLPVRHNLIWVKNSACFSLGRLDYDYRHEPIFYTWTKRHEFYGGYSTTVIDDTTPIDKMSKAELKELVRALQEEHPESVIYCDKPLKSDLHPTMKPVKLVARLMANSSKPGDPVCDIFGGSGTTLIAAEQLNRTAYLMEIDPHYCDVIIQRWEEYTGKTAKLIE